ncbi:putative pectinesterase/pectinesterase inhibitor 41 [Nymphaea thermarum]|nr:putative pectinesterase/pectinesterase inhibitor 41 [Nymphaea thermarum]
MIRSFAAAMTSFFFLLTFLLPLSFSFPQMLTPDTACNVTTNPSFCKSLLPADSLSNFYSYGQYLVKKSLEQSAAFSSLINETIRDHATLTPRAAAALNDCLLLSELTTDFLVSSLATLDSGNTTTLARDKADLVHTLLSGIVTNQHTCLDELTLASFLHRGHKLYAPLVNGSQLYSLSLAMLTHSWAFKPKKLVDPGRRLLDDLRVGGDGAPLWVNRNIFHFAGGRRMALQSVGSVVVAPDGSGHYRTIREAIAAAPANDGSNGYYVINVKAGVYEEYVIIPKSKKYIMMVGDGMGKTVITGDRSVGGGGSTTFGSATLAVLGTGFLAMDITVRNTAGTGNHQAVAVRNGADLSVFFRCSFEGYQDTLYAYSLRQFYRNCDIYGTVDFIFGNAAAVFQSCNIYARVPGGKVNTVTAQGRTSQFQNTGTSFIGCNVAAASDLAGRSGIRTYLGRPWKEYSRTVFMESNLGSLIDPAGWMPWSGSSAPSTIYYGEYSNRGPGAATGGRVKWEGFHLMSSSDAGRFTVSNFIQGSNWLPKTGVPFG